MIPYQKAMIFEEFNLTEILLDSMKVSSKFSTRKIPLESNEPSSVKRKQAEAINAAINTISETCCIRKV